MKKKVTIIGSTGSVGVNALKVVKEYGGLFEVTGLSAGSNVELLKKQIEEFKPQAVFLNDESLVPQLTPVTGSFLLMTQMVFDFINKHGQKYHNAEANT